MNFAGFPIIEVLDESIRPIAPRAIGQLEFKGEADLPVSQEFIDVCLDAVDGHPFIESFLKRVGLFADDLGSTGAQAVFRVVERCARTALR